MRRAPGAERCRGRVSCIDVDEDGAVGLERDWQLEREVAPGGPGGFPVHAQGHEPAFDAESLEGADLLRLGRGPAQVRVLEHLVERKQAPHEQVLRSGPAVADVLGAERVLWSG